MALSNLSRIGAILAFFGIADTADLVEEHGPRIFALWARAVAEIDSQPPPSESEHLERYAAAARTAYDAVALPARVGARGWCVVDGRDRSDERMEVKLESAALEGRRPRPVKLA